MTASAAVAETATDGFAPYRRATVALGQMINDGGIDKFNTIGTGVIIGVAEHTACLVTAKHVISQPGYAPTSLQMRLAIQDGDPPFGIALPLVDRFGRNLWVSLPDDSDIALIKLPDMSQYKNIFGVGPSEFGTQSDLVQGGPVIIIGYPAIASALTSAQDVLVSPIARGGIIAWVDPQDPIGKPFIVDANLWQGNSGGPVFRQRGGLQPSGRIVAGGGISFIGIVSKGGAQKAPVQMEGQNLQNIDTNTGRISQYYALVNNVGGIGYIEPASKVKQLIDQHCR